jgi:hypothetical protein
VTPRRRLAVLLAGAVAASAVGCGPGPELEQETVRNVLQQPGTIPPTPPMGSYPRSEELDPRCPYLRPGRGFFAEVRPDACRHLRRFRTPTGTVHVELTDPVSRRPVTVSPIEKPSPDVRVVRFTYRWDTDSIDESVRSCFHWGEGAALVRFARVGRKWQLSGFEEIVYERTEETCPG